MRKREGDGASPVGAMAMLGAYRRPGAAGAMPAPPLPWRWTHRLDGWCDEPRHPAYNRPVRLPFSASAETLQRPDRLYDLVVVLDWNLRRRARGRGSAIFLHVAREKLAPTEGCVALARRDLARIAPYLKPGRKLRIAR